MPPLNLASIRSQGVRSAPAIALLEVLVAAAILAAIVLAFLTLLSESRVDLSRARQSSESIALARALLEQAPADWEGAPTNGETNGLRWTRHCELSSSVRSQRLVLLICSVAIEGAASVRTTLETAWALPRTRLLQP